ncbi:MAG: Macrolide export ATP-binding/permease protein MacB [Candidatus Izimaplasma bacterium HR2]|nr:MAG: Macrolide export ATP-binding/permease protein MacB [Candidatus Izimaplasma bacterium HR2]
MLELKKISKDYQVGTGIFRALNEIDLKFNKGEFVAILGHSGCGKTTSLNIIGGLDRYTEGDLIINGTSTKSFTEKDWDSYRNNSIGFVFQSYNLINHLTVLDNVELGMTLSGVGKTERQERAISVLKRVGLEYHMNKKPTLLSGGEKQRVAIARALVNDPDIILADEPTGALDSKTAREILDLIKEISSDKLVIMVTHEAKYAEEYASRTVKLLDGEVIEDTGEIKGMPDLDGYKPKKTSMSFFTALKLSFNNLKTKKFRTTITAFASSIGIIGVGLVLSISNGFSGILDDLESDQLVGLPIMITEGELMFQGPPISVDNTEAPDSEEDEVAIYDPDDYTHVNNITPNFVSYLETMDNNIYTALQYNYGYTPRLLVEDGDIIKLIDSRSINLSSFITPEDELADYYDVLEGDFPTNQYEVSLLVRDERVVDIDVLEALGFNTNSPINFDEIIGKKIYVVNNNDLYAELGDSFLPNISFDDSDLVNAIELTITGIIQMIDDTVSLGGDNGIYYLYDLESTLINSSINSNICVAQDASNTSVFNDELLTEDAKFNMLSTLGCNNEIPRAINIYSDSIDNKTAIKDFISLYNEGLVDEDQIVELDLAETIGNTMGTIISMISIVLSAFASISLVVSSVMIGIIIYISVLERTKEIGIIRSLGGRKKDVSRVFNAESIIIGAFAGVLGVTITYLLTFPINFFAEKFDEGLGGVAQADPLHLIALILISTLLTFIGGFIPATIAAKKNPVEALRVE